MRLTSLWSAQLATLLAIVQFVTALGQKPIISFTEQSGAFQLTGGNLTRPQILVSSDDYWGVIRTAGSLAEDFGRVTGSNFSLSNGEKGSEPASYKYHPIAANGYIKYVTNGTEHFYGPNYTDPQPANTAIIVGTLNHSKVIDDLVSSGKLDVSGIKGKWESFVSQVVEEPIAGCSKALVIAGSDARGSIFGIYDVSEQIGVSPWYWWADVPVKQNKQIYALPEGKVQGPPSVKYRGLFLNDEQPGLSGWVKWNYEDTPYGVGYNHHFYPNVFELLLRLRANYLWPTVWGSMFEVDDPANQPLADAWEIVLGSSHTEPMMRAQNEFGEFYQPEGLGEWAYNLNNQTINEYFQYGAERAKPYARNSLWTMSMRGTGDTAIEGLGSDAIITMLEEVVKNQRQIIEDTLGVDIDTVPQSWCLYKEVQSYLQEGMVVPDSITLLWSDDNWGNVRRVPIKNETNRSGGAGVYYHFDYVGDPRNYKWINTIQLQKTAEQMQLAYSHGADQIWIVNVGDLKPLEVPISHFLDMAYDTAKWGVNDVSDWTAAWAKREFGSEQAEDITDIMNRYGMYAARRKYELIAPYVYSVLNYNEADAVLEQWQELVDDTQSVYDKLDESHQPAFFEMILHPVLAGQIVHQVHIGAEKNIVYANQHRNSANSMASKVISRFNADGALTSRWDRVLDGKWKRMLDQTHFGYNGYWQQPMRNVMPAVQYVQEEVSSIAGDVGIAVEGLNASIPGDDQWHTNSGASLELPPLDRYGASMRWIDVFSRGTKRCSWKAETGLSWVKLSKSSGVTQSGLGTNGSDTRIYVSVDWENVPDLTNDTVVNINFTAGCGDQGFTEWFAAPYVELPISTRNVPSDFTQGFVESDGHVAIEGPNYQRIHRPAGTSNSSVTYQTLQNYGRTMGGVTLWPQTTPGQTPETAPALEYDLYLFSNATAANVTLYLSPTQNYRSDEDPVSFGASLFPAGEAQADPQVVQFVGPSVGASMEAGWGYAVADAVWGVDPGHNTTTTWNVSRPGAYTLRLWGLMPSVIVQKVVVDLGGVRPSYLGPPESFLVGRDQLGQDVGASFASRPGVLGRLSSS